MPPRIISPSDNTTGYGTPVNIDASLTSLSTGSLTTVARADHVHTVSNVVTSIVAGTGIAVSGATGSVSISSPAAMTLLGSTTLTSAAATISVSGIVPSYTDLIWVLANARVTGSANESVYIRFNGDTGNNYIVGATANNFMGYVMGTSTTNAHQMYTWASQRILLYSDTSTYKMTAYDVYSYIGSSNVLGGTISPGVWKSTAAVTSVSLTATLTSLTIGTKFSVYGVL